jgi:hypothetical protein
MDTFSYWIVGLDWSKEIPRYNFGSYKPTRENAHEKLYMADKT